MKVGDSYRGESVSYRVHITGRAWGGFSATHIYETGSEPKGRKDVERLAVDFETVETFLVLKVTTTSVNECTLLEE